MCFVFLTFSLKAYLQTTDKKLLEEKKAKIEKEIKITSSLIEDTRSQKKSSLSELKLLKNNISKRNQLINTLNDEIEGINSDIDKNSKLI
jgi:murein hydrolase activator